jgi:hypothetical protein
MSTNDKDTYFSRAQADADDAGGRYAKLNPAKITGSTPAPSYPTQPGNSPWASSPVPPNRASDELGFSINDQEAVGTPAEIEQSIRALKADVVGVGALPSADDLGGPEAPNDATCPSDVETKPAQTTTSMKRVW